MGELRLCKACGIEKDVNEFYRRKTGKIKVPCKACYIAREIRRAQESPEIQEYRRGYLRVWNKTPTGREAHRAYAARQRAARTPEEKAAWNTSRKASDKTRARAAVRRAMKSGKLADPQKCALKSEQCWGRLEWHHYRGYAKEHHLDVMRVCRHHHMQIEQEPGIWNGFREVEEKG